MSDKWWAVHEAACNDGLTTYLDPESGFQVFTRLGLLERGRCCGAGCRHCPYHHESISLDERASLIKQPAWLTEFRPSEKKVCVLFWSGGKDSYLAYRKLSEAGVEVTLLTTFDLTTGVIAHQDLSIQTIVGQAKHLGLPLIGVPLHSEQPYEEHIVNGLKLVDAKQLAFGDLHLQLIREWREKTFGEDPRTQDLELVFPIWRVSYDELLKELSDADVRCTISAVTLTDSGIVIGDEFDHLFLERLPKGVDGFGENGEFHTLISFREDLEHAGERI